MTAATKAREETDMHDDLRFIRTPDAPHVYCIVNGRRRFVPYAEWFRDEGLAGIPHIEIIEWAELARIPLGPPCPVTAALRARSMAEVLREPNLMRLYLANLVRGEGIEFGAGRRPLPVPLAASVRYVDAFAYGSDESRSFPGVADFEDFVEVDLVGRIETMEPLGNGSVDFVLASHVIEHTPDPIGALVASHRVLRDAGRLVLVVPDRDRTFDQPREVTPIAHMVLDHEDYRRERDLAHYEEWHSLVMAGPGGAARTDWEIGADLHYHCFTPASFIALVAASMQYARWSGAEFFLPPPDAPPASIEFYAVLRK
ncbi:MAG: methyltransferase domain-containing protein [Acetobacteraceae bacterium]